MRLVTRQTLANSAAARWEANHPDGHVAPRRVIREEVVRDSEDCYSVMPVYDNPAPTHQIRDALRALGPTPHPDDVDATVAAAVPFIRGIYTWVPSCRVCGALVGAVVQMVECEDLCFCRDCLTAAVALFPAPESQ